MTKSQTQFFYKNFSWNLYRVNFDNDGALFTQNSVTIRCTILHYIRIHPNQWKISNTFWVICEFWRLPLCRVLVRVEINVSIPHQNEYLQKRPIYTLCNISWRTHFYENICHFCVYSSFLPVDLCVWRQHININPLYHDSYWEKRKCKI